MIPVLHDSPIAQLLNTFRIRKASAFPDVAPGFQPSFGVTDKSIPILKSTNTVRSKPMLLLDEQSTIIVDWYHDEDKENPRNWPPCLKIWVTFGICLYTFVVYSASAIYVPSIPFIVARYQISVDIASLGLACYIIGYGVGPMFFSPLSEIAPIGRNVPYISSFILFLVVSVLVAVVDNFPAFVFLRLLQGISGSPALATGAASLEDIYRPDQVPYAFIFWVGAMYGGPALGPLLSGYAVSTNWRWPMYQTVIMGGVLFLILLTLPETSAANILLRRARRLRRSQKSHRYRSAYEMSRKNIRRSFIDAMIKPFEISVKDPAIAFACFYAAVLYGTYYSFFEVFPLVYMDLHQFSIGASLVYTTIIVGLIVVVPIYAMYLKWVFLPKFESATFEDRLYLALFASWFPIVGLLIFAWTAKSTIHWIWPTIGVGIYAGSSFIIFQCLVCWLPLSYPRYTASLMAGNDLCRSLFAAVLVMVSRQMYLTIGVSQGVTLLAGLSCIGVIGMAILYRYGAAMRARSRFTSHEGIY